MKKILLIRIELGDRNPEKIRETLEGIRNRYQLNKISKSDYEILGNACRVAIEGRWNEATRMLGVEQPGEGFQDKEQTPSNATPLKAGGSIFAHGIKIPLPEGASILKYTPGRPPFDDDVWRIAFDPLQGITEFYTYELNRSGWYLDQFMKNCWTKPRPKKQDQRDCMCSHSG